MRDIRIRAQRKNARSEISWAYYVFLMFGVLGLLLAVRSSGMIFFSVSAAFGAACVEAAFLTAVYIYCHKLFPLALLTDAAAFGLAFFFGFGRISAEASLFADYLFGDAGSGEDGDITRLAVMFALCITLFFFVLECVMKRHFPAYLLTLAVLLLSPAAGIIPDMAAVGCILVFQTVFFAFGAVKPKSRRRALSSQPKLSAVKNGTIVSGIALAALIFASVSVSGHAGVFYGAVDRAEGAVLTCVRDVTGRSEQIDTGGSISYGNNYRSGTKLFTVSVSMQPDRAIYLAGFRGGDYTGGSFEPADDAPGSGEKIDIDNTYYLLKASEDTAGGILDTTGRVSADWCTMLMDYGTSEVYSYVHPYNYVYTGFLSSSREKNFYNASKLFISCYCAPDFTVDIGNINTGSDSADRYFENTLARYGKTVQEFYTAVPEDLVPRLAGLVRENPFDSLDEITSFIIYTLNSNCKYTLKPGMAPFNEDITEYFLFERGEGYCEQYAAAATLMYRLYGIPARYVSGYRIDADDWYADEKQTGISLPFSSEHLKVSADVTGFDAHAWVELYSPEKGWYPVEVTPAQDGTFAAPYEGLDISGIKAIMEENEWDISVPSITERKTSGDGGPISYFVVPPKMKENTAYAAGGACIALPFIALCLIKERRRRLKAMNAGQSFARMVCIMHGCGILAGSDGTERQFADALAGETKLDGSKIKSAQTLALKSSFSAEGTSAEEDAAVMGMLKDAEAAMKSSMNLLQRLKIIIFSV